MTTAFRPPSPTHPAGRCRPNRRQALCCGAAAAAGLFSALLVAESDAASRGLADAPCRGAGTGAADPHGWAGSLPADHPAQGLLQASLAALDPAELWDVHAHLLGTGDAGSGCTVDARMSQWWHPVASLRRQVILRAAGVPSGATSVDRAYVAQLQSLTAGFPAGARWLLFAFDLALDDAGIHRPDWTTFHVPDRHAAQVAADTPQRFGWVASVHPRRPDALARLDAAIDGGALAVKWLPSAMNIDLADPRLAPFYARLAQERLPLIVHCGEERAVPGAGRQALGNPLAVRVPLAAGVRVIVAHCASLGQAPDTDLRQPRPAQAFALFARLMDEGHAGLLGDVSALFQVNRRASVWRTVLSRPDWHARLLHGSDHPLPAVGPLYQPAALVAAGLLPAADLAPLRALRASHPLLFDLVLKRRVRWQGQGLSDVVFRTRQHFVGAASARPARPVHPGRVSPDDTQRRAAGHIA
jgi:uncharacterized protein